MRSELCERERDARDQSATADRDEDHLGGKLTRDLNADSALTRDHQRVIVRMDQGRAGFSADICSSALRGLVIGAFEHYALPIAPNRFDFGYGGAARNDDRGADARQRGRVRERLPMISGGSGDDAARGFFAGKRDDAIVSAANLEGAGLLKIFGLDEDLGFEHAGERFAADHWRRLDDRSKTAAGKLDIAQRWNHRGAALIAARRRDLVIGARAEAIGFELDADGTTGAVVEIEKDKADGAQLDLADERSEAWRVV